MDSPDPFVLAFSQPFKRELVCPNLASGIVERDPGAGLISHSIETCPDGAWRVRLAVEMDRSWRLHDE